MTLSEGTLYNANGGDIIPQLISGISQNSSITVSLETLGCKLNQAETELIARQLSRSGYRVVPPGEKADIYILNTCTVTHVSDRKSRHLLRMAHRRNPEAKIVVTGCYAEHAAGELSQIEGVCLVAGNREKANLPQLLSRLVTGSLSTGGGDPVAQSSRTRTFIKAQDGCNQFCTYCIVPLVRGREKSLPAEQVIHEIRSRTSEGFQEIVLTGTEIGRYRSEGLALTGLLSRILAETEIRRLRLSSLQPGEISGSFLDFWKDERLCRHFHLSLQSGSESVLRRMNRRYTLEEYENAAGLIRSLIPGVSITTDIIVGFPGETEKEFAESLEFCRRMEYARIHVFPYSPRQGTRAAGFPDRVDPGTIKQRSELMLALAASSLRDYNRRFAGSTLPVLFEQNSGSLWSGLTDNYIRVYTKSSRDLTNRILPVRLSGSRADGMEGELEN